MPALAQANYHRDQSTLGLSVQDDDGRSAVARIRNDMMNEGARFAPQLAALSAGFEGAADEVTANVARLRPDVLTAENRQSVIRRIRPPWKALQGKVQEESRDYATDDARAVELPMDLPLAAEDRKQFTALSIGDKANWIKDADRIRLAAILQGGRARFADVPDELWQQIEDRYRVLTHIERTGLQADFQLQPNAQNPAIIGPDREASEKAAQQALAEFRQRKHVITEAEDVLRQTIIAVALMTDATVDQAFELLNGKAA